MAELEEFYERISKELNASEEDFLKESMRNVLYITDLKPDDNAGFLKLIKFNEEERINYNIKVLVTNIKNFHKMIKNLLTFDEDKIIEKNIKKGVINFYKGIESSEKKYESYVMDIENDENCKFVLKDYKDLNQEKFSTCYGFAPFYQFKDLIKNSGVFVFGHGYNSEIKENNDVNYKKMVEELLEINKYTIMVGFNNNVTFTKIGGKINKHNKKLEKLIRKDDIRKRFIDQAKNDEINFIVNKALSKNAKNKELLGKLEESLELEKIGIRVKEHFDKYDDELKNKLCEINEKYNIEIINGKNKVKDFKFKKAAESVKSENILEVTDWSQMELYLKLISRKYNKDIQKRELYYKEGNNFVEFLKTNEINEGRKGIYIPLNVDWDELFEIEVK